MPFAQNDFIPVILGTGLNAYGIARALHEAYGVKSLALGRAQLAETSSSKILEVRTSESYGNSDDLVQALLKLRSEFPGKRLLLLPTIETYTNTVVKNHKLLSSSFKIPVVHQDLAERLINKADFYKTCADLGIDHPRSIIFDEADIASPEFGSDLPFNYPVILKPSDTELYPNLRFVGQKKIYLVANKLELQEFSTLIYNGGYLGELIAQEYLRGDETIMKVANTYSDSKGKTRYVSIAQIVLAEHSPKLVGNMNAVVTISDPELANTLTRFLDSVEYRGAANFDIMYDSVNKTNKLLEINVRQGAASYYATGTGDNLPARYVEDLILEKDLSYTETQKITLWRNAPLWIVKRYVPSALRSLVKDARRNRVVHTLWYRKDLNLRRILVILKHELRTGRNIVRNEKFRINRSV